MRTGLYAVVLSIAFLFLTPGKGGAANFMVNPVKLFFSPKQKTDIIKIKNNAEQELSLQLTVFSWAQDEEAEDMYSPTEDIIVFPKILTIEGGTERIIRVGTRVPAGNGEKTYRLFLEELPTPRDAPEEGATLRTLMKVGVPIFIAPVRAEAAGGIEGVGLKKGRLSLTVRNTGNVHFIIRAVNVEGMDAAGASVFQEQLKGWYLHGGNDRAFSLDIPEESCLRSSFIKVEVVTDKLSMDERLDVLPEMCSP